jgi:hypothetical protein
LAAATRAGGADDALPAATPPSTSVDTLVAGENTIQVQVATTLNNRLRVEQPDVFASQPRQDFGLLGPSP